MSLGSSLMSPQLFTKIPWTMESGLQAAKLVESMLGLLKCILAFALYFCFEPYHLDPPQCNSAHLGTHSHGPHSWFLSQ